MTEPVRISGKDLGALAMSEFCARCFWIQRRAPDGLPYQIFPGIFSSIDSYTKKVIHGWFDQRGAAPQWLGALGPLTGYVNPPHHSKFRLLDEGTNILLTGVVDGIFVRPDGSHLIVDYKTAKFTENAGSLFPIYRTQLNAYALIAEAVGIAPVSGLALIYTEPLTDEAAAHHDANARPDGFAMGFSAHILDVALDVSQIRPLLRRVRQVLDSPTAPPSLDGCRDCAKLDGVLGIVRLSR